MVAAYLGGPWLLVLSVEDADVISYGLLRMSIICTTYFLCGMMDTMVGSIRGLGYSIPADACLSDRRLRTASDLDLYHICSAAVAGDPVSVVPDLLGGHSDGTYDLLLAGGEETAEGRRSSGAGIEFETM